MKVLKRNQLVILVISLMLVTAGYLNFTATYKGNEEMEQASTDIARDTNVIDNGQIGDATLVNGDAIVENTPEAEGNIAEEDGIQDNDVVSTSTNKEDDYYFENSKLDRDKMYSQMLEAYQKMYDNAAVPVDQKAIAGNEITKINNLKNAIMISENLIMTKGFENVVIFVNDTQVSVIVKGEELVPEKIAQIQNIVARELNVAIENIHISCNG